MSPLDKLRRSFQKQKNLRQSRSALHLTPHPVSYYANLLSANAPFSFARYGDGEWSAIFGRSGANCDGHPYTSELGKRLASALKDHYPYFYALQYYGLKMDGPHIVSFCKQHSISLPFHNADVFAFANVLGGLYPFIRELREKQVVVIGPGYMRGIDSVFPVSHFFEVPETNCFSAADEISGQILSWGKNKTGIVYSFSASMAANVMIHDLFKDLGKANWLLDLGSLWDLYVGKKSRGWFQTLDLVPAIARNTGTFAESHTWKSFRDSITLLFNRFHVKT